MSRGAFLVSDAPTRTSVLGGDNARLKWLTAILVFTVLVTGWAGFARYRANHTPLPGLEGRQGPCALWFIGSSTIHRWIGLDAAMTPFSAHNRGVNAALIRDIEPRFRNDPVAVPPGAIIFYGGDNDLAQGETPASALAQVERFIADRDRAMPDVPVVLLTLKASPARWKERDRQVAFDAGLRALTQRHQRLRLLDIRPLLLVNGRPGSFYQPDGLHLDARGYALLNAAVRREVTALLPDQARTCPAPHEAS